MREDSCLVCLVQHGGLSLTSSIFSALPRFGHDPACDVCRDQCLSQMRETGFAGQGFGVTGGLVGDGIRAPAQVS